MKIPKTVIFEEETLKEVEEQAKVMEMTSSQLIRKATKDYLKK